MEDMEVDGDIYSEKSILDENELRALCNKLGLKYNMIDLSELGENDSFYGFIHTGTSENSYNKGNENHWMAFYGPNVFDSYGKHSLWKIPSNFSWVQTIPKALQEYNTNVCGAYCAAYLDFCNKNGSDGSDDLGREFCNEFDFTKNREENDTKILSWYDSIMGKQST